MSQQSNIFDCDRYRLFIQYLCHESFCLFFQGVSEEHPLEASSPELADDIAQMPKAAKMLGTRHTAERIFRNAWYKLHKHIEGTEGFETLSDNEKAKAINDAADLKSLYANSDYYDVRELY